MPWLLGAFLFAVLRVGGLPGLNNFVSEFLVILGTFAVEPGSACSPSVAVVLCGDLPAVGLPADGVRSGP